MNETENPGRRVDGYKTWMDITILIVAHLLLLPLWIVLWLAIPALIWLEDRGPILYRQIRVGKNGREFTIIKFRSMVPDADSTGPAWTTTNDPRVTRFGRILRRTGLDELPEVINIFRGQMSLVGPRALGLEEQKRLEQDISGFSQRLSVRPGLTGLAQIHDRRDDSHDKFKYDMDYIQRMNPWLDIQFLTQSVWNTAAVRWDRREGKISPSTETADSASDVYILTSTVPDQSQDVDNDHMETPMPPKRGD